MTETRWKTRWAFFKKTIYFTVILTFIGCTSTFLGYQLGWITKSQDALFLVILSYVASPILALFLSEN